MALFTFKKAFWTLLGQLKGFNVAVLSYTLTGVFRYRFGVRNCGLILSLAALSFLLVMNSANIPVYAKPFLVYTWPLLFIWKTPGELYQWAFVEVNSTGLLIWTIVLGVNSIIHIGMAYCGFGNSNPSKRGESWIYTALSWAVARYPKIKISEFFICCFVEPLIAIGAGIYVWTHFDDRYFAVACFLAGLCEIVQGLTRKSWELHQQPILRA